MQREAFPSDVRHGYVLATWLQRFAAHLIDRLIVWGLLTVGLLGLAAGIADIIFTDYHITTEEEWVPVLSDVVQGGWGWWLFFASGVALPAYAVWFLFTLRNGQTPGKQMVGIRVIRANGELSGWGYTFVREFILEWLAVGFLSGVTGGIFYAVNYLWPLWDKDRQALHDKMAETLVVVERPLSATGVPVAGTSSTASDTPVAKKPGAEGSEDAPGADDPK